MINTMNQIATTWWTYSMSMLWQVGLLIVVIGCVDVLLRKHIWPQIRYALWLMVLVKLMLPPGLHSPSSLTSGVHPLARRLTVTPVVQQANKTPILYRSLTSTPSSIELDHTELRSTGQAYVTPSLQIVTTSIQTPETPSVMARLTWHVYAMGLWIVGTGTFGLWLGMRLRRLRQGLPSFQSKLPASFYDQLDICAKRVGLKTTPKVVVTNRVIVPAVMGIWRPVLLMPVGFLGQLSRQGTKHMLLHELAHIKRGDLWVHSLYMILQITYWYNPLLWLVSRQMHHLRELCCDATVAGLLKEQTMEYRNTLLDVAKRYLSRPTEPSLGLLGLFEDSNRLAIRLNWLKKDTHRFRKTRTLLILVLVGVMLACVLPMAQADDTPATSQTKAAGAAAQKSPPDEYAELIKEIDALRQRLIQKQNTPSKLTETSEATVPPPTQSDVEKETLRNQVQYLEQQQLALIEQLNQLKAALGQTEKTKPQQKGLKQQFHLQLKQLDSAKEKLKDLAMNERVLELQKHVEHMAHKIDENIDVNNLHVMVKTHLNAMSDQILPQIHQWSDSDELKQWQKDVKAWEREMQAWSKDFAKATEGKIKNLKNSDMSFHVPMPKMPKMPAMPPMPFKQEKQHETPVIPSMPNPDPNVHPHVQIEAHVVTPGVPLSARHKVIGTMDELTFIAPAAEAKKVGEITIAGSAGHAHEQPAKPGTPKAVRIIKRKTNAPASHLEHVAEHEVHMDKPELVQIQEHEIHTVAPKLVRISKTKSPVETLANTTKIMTLSFPDAKCKSVKLNNKVGDITVLGTDNDQCSVEIKITARAKDASIAKDLADQVHVTTDEIKNVLTITPEVPDNSEDAQVTVAFSLKIPRTLNLNLSTDVGNITTRNMQSQINCRVNVGNINAQAMTKALTANTNVGQIFLSVTDDTDAKISASTNVGQIQSKQAFTRRPTKMTGARGTLTLGSGKPRVNLKVNVGSIHVGPHTKANKASTGHVITETHQITTTSN